MAGWIDPEEREEEARQALGLDDNGIDMGDDTFADEEEDILGLGRFKSLSDAQGFLAGGKSPLLGGALPEGYGAGVGTADDTEARLLGEMEAAREAKTASMGSITDVLQRQRQEDEARLNAMRKPLTDEELDRRRAAGTMVSSITSALANIANGIAVSRGAMNATVPDGYTLSYQHWNDVEKRNKARQAEYDKIVDSIWKSRLTETQLKYGADSEEYKLAEARYNSYVTEKRKLQNDAMKRQQGLQDKMFLSDYEFENYKRKRDYAVEHPLKGTKTSTSSDEAKEYGYVSDDGMINITFPQGMSSSDAYTKMASVAIGRIKEQLEQMEKDAINGVVSKNLQDARLAELRQTKEYKDLVALKKTIQSNSSNAGTKQGRTALGKNIAASGVTQEELESILNESAAASNQKTRQNTGQGNGDSPWNFTNK